MPRSRTIVLLVNGSESSPMGYRARAFEKALREDARVLVEYRNQSRLKSIFTFRNLLSRERPDIVYVLDMGYSGVIAALAHKLVSRTKVIVDTGDAIYELAKAVGERSRIGLGLTWLLERIGIVCADHIVVRGTEHKALMGRDAVTVIQDGFESESFCTLDVTELRRELQLEEVLTVGFVGSLTWSSKSGRCYGSELIEVLCELRDLPVKGIIIGDGSGAPKLRAQARQLGIEDKIVFLGRIPYEDLSRYLCLIDVCLSTQTNDVPGRVRTTGKLPLYLATGRFILASRVGEAARVLPQEMLVDYYGSSDLQYPNKLATRIRTLLRGDSIRKGSLQSRAIAAENFDYAVLTSRLKGVIRSIEGYA